MMICADHQSVFNIHYPCPASETNDTYSLYAYYDLVYCNALVRPHSVVSHHINKPGMGLLVDSSFAKGGTLSLKIT